MKRCLGIMLIGCLLFVCPTGLLAQQQHRSSLNIKQKTAPQPKKVNTRKKTPPSPADLAQQLQALEAKLAQLQTKARSLEKASQQTLKTWERKVTDLGTGTGKQEKPTPETQADMIGFTKKGNTYTLAAHGAKIEIDPAGNILLQTTGILQIESNALLHARSGMIKLGRNAGRPVAALGDIITGHTIIKTACQSVVVE